MLTKDQIIEGISQLNQDDRDAVLDVLIRKLNELDDRILETASDEEWTAEIDRRLERYDRGETVARSWEEVDADLEQRLKRIERRSTEPQ